LDFIVTKKARQNSEDALEYSNFIESPSVSWILCTHAGGPLLYRAIASCLEQTYTDFELILVINGSDKNCIKELVMGWDISSDPRIKIYETEVRHLPFSLSLGLHHARGKYIARMDGDDIAYPHRLQVQLEFMKNNPDVSVLGTAFEVIDLLDKPISVVRNPLTDIGIRQAMIFKNPLCHPTIMFKRDTVLAAGGYLGGFHSEDYDLWLRLSNYQEIKFANLSMVCLGYRSVSVGTARKSRDAYASMAGSQLRSFLVRWNIRWLIAALISLIKMILILLANLVESDSMHKIKIKKDK